MHQRRFYVKTHREGKRWQTGEPEDHPPRMLVGSSGRGEHALVVQQISPTKIATRLPACFPTSKFFKVAFYKLKTFFQNVLFLDMSSTFSPNSNNF